MVFLALPLTHAHTHTVFNATHTLCLPSVFFASRLVYKLEQLRFAATSDKPVLPVEARPRLVTFSMDHYELETQAGPAQFF